MIPRLVIIGLSPTRMDQYAAVRIWGLLDDVLPKLVKILKAGGGKDGGSLPHPDCKRAGDTWKSKHPNCKYNTPVRKKPTPNRQPSK